MLLPAELNGDIQIFDMFKWQLLMIAPKRNILR